jgi:hypothetical protein
LALVQWARWYKSLYEMPSTDRPDDKLLGDDAALDRWYEQYARDMARKLARGNRGAGPSYAPQVEYAGGLPQ